MVLLVGLSGCRQQPHAKPTKSIESVNSELSSLKKNRVYLRDTVSVSTLVVDKDASEVPARAPVSPFTLEDETDASGSPAIPATPKRVRLPAPLRPQRQAAGPEADAPQPCTIVASRICSILTEGAEECAEARQVLPSLENVDAQARCAKALGWYERRFSDERRTKPCALLADVVCRQAGQNSVQCKRAKEDIRLLRKTIQHACKAGILMTLAFR